MKKVLKISGITLAVLLAALVLLPIIFKKDIKKAVDVAIADSINGKVYYDENSFSVGLFKNFPNLSVGVSNFGVIGAENFSKDTLVDITDFSLAVDIMSIFSGEQIEMTSLLINKALINLIVLEDSTANYLDLVKGTNDEKEESSEFAYAGKWEIKNSIFRYKDETSKTYININGFNHSGNGNFTQDVFDLATNTDLKEVNLEMAGVDYLSKASIYADVALNMDMQNSKYTFKENLVKLNDFSIGFDGWLQMNEDESMNMDIKYETKDTEFKNILSLVPGFFMKDFEEIKTKGSLSFLGDVKGKYDSLSMPGVNFTLKVDEAMFKFPDLPSAVENIAMDLTIKSEQNKLEEMDVNLKQFHLDMGDNPIDAKTEMKFKGSFEKIFLTSDINAKVNLSDINKFYPVVGLEMKGLFSLMSKAMGTFDMENNTFPSSNTNMSLENGFVKSAELPAPLENINFKTSIKNENGSLAQTFIDLSNFSMLLDGSPFEMTAKVNDLEAVNFDVSMNGKLDFEKLTKIYPLEDMSLKGILDIKNLSTKGSMKDVEAENYGNIPTSGLMSFSNFEYYDKEYVTNGFKMTDALFAFTPSKIMIEKFEGYLGNSDLNVKGELSNYINYIFGENEMLKGSMTLNSQSFDVDEWMVEEEESVEDSEEALEVIEIPKNIDFNMNSSIANVKYDNMGIQNMEGSVSIKDGQACFNNVNFKCIGGDFQTTGCYDASDLQNPKFNYDLAIENASIPKAYEVFSTVKIFAPIAKMMEGNFSTKFNVNGPLDQELFPIMSKLKGLGDINLIGAKFVNIFDKMSVDEPGLIDADNLLLIAQIDLVQKALIKSLKKGSQKSSNDTKSSIFQKIKTLTNIDLFNQVMSPTTLSADLSDGKLKLSPFVTKIGENILDISGSNGIDGVLEYFVKMNVPAGKLGEAAGKAVSNLIGSDVKSDRAILGLKIAGLMNDPKVALDKKDTKSTATDIVKKSTEVKKEETKEKVTEKVEDVKEDMKAKADAILTAAQKQAEAIKSTSKSSAEKIRREGYANAKKLENSSSNPIKKKVNKLAADKLRNVADSKANKIIKEGDAKADGIMAKARKQVNDLYNK